MVHCIRQNGSFVLQYKLFSKMHFIHHYASQCRNYGNVHSRQKFVKTTVLIKKLQNSCFHEIFLIFHTVRILKAESKHFILLWNKSIRAKDNVKKNSFKFFSWNHFRKKFKEYFQSCIQTCENWEFFLSLRFLREIELISVVSQVFRKIS